MSLATRCVTCGTVFRVVQDQLRVSGGWVRCGRCSEVFNAVESLVDLETDRPADGTSPGTHGERVMQDLAEVAGAPAVTKPARAPTTAGATPLMVRSVAANEAWPPAADGPPEPANDRSARPPVGSTLETLSEAPAPLAAPAFLQQADRAARWRRPRVRAGLALLAVIAGASLGLQLSWAYHDTLAARWPATRPLIERLCLYGGCTVEPPRRIDSLGVESSSLTRAGPPGAYRLSLLLRNRDRMALRLPSIDLSLTDAQGRTLARRVLDPGQLGAVQPSIGAGAEQPLATTLRTGDGAVVGYTIEIFYP